VISVDQQGVEDLGLSKFIAVDQARGQLILSPYCFGDFIIDSSIEVKDDKGLKTTYKLEV
jgi:hypothetical protein